LTIRIASKGVFSRLSPDGDWPVRTKALRTLNEKILQ
jgi:hypothetical protein